MSDNDTSLGPKRRSRARPLDHVRRIPDRPPRWVPSQDELDLIPWGGSGRDPRLPPGVPPEIWAQSYAVKARGASIGTAVILDQTAVGSSSVQLPAEFRLDLRDRRKPNQVDVRVIERSNHLEVGITSLASETPLGAVVHVDLSSEIFAAVLTIATYERGDHRAFARDDREARTEVKRVVKIGPRTKTRTAEDADRLWEVYELMHECPPETPTAAYVAHHMQISERHAQRLMRNLRARSSP